MEKRTKELRSISIESASGVMEDLARALSGNGPALAFGPTLRTEVPDDIAIVVATSGSTGKPKEVALGSRAIIASAQASNAFLGAHFGDTWSLLLPLNHIAGVNVLARSLELGTTPIDLRATTKYPQADFTAIVPTQLFRALNGDQHLLTHLHHCRAVLVGGAALSDQLKSQALGAGINIVTTYGMTETCGGCVYNGKAINDVEIDIRDGLVSIKGPVLASSYLNDESAWAKSFQDGWFTTQDRGVLDSNILTVLGRSDEIIVSGGEKISLYTVEEIIRENFPALRFAVFPMEDLEWGTTLNVAMTSDSSTTEEDISQTLIRALGPIVKPKSFLRIAEIPLSGIGKVDRSALVELAITERGKR